VTKNGEGRRGEAAEGRCEEVGRKSWEAGREVGEGVGFGADMREVSRIGTYCQWYWWYLVAEDRVGQAGRFVTPGTGDVPMEERLTLYKTGKA
jgi:hypothetical protein